jgi:hypothetical protein
MEVIGTGIVVPANPTGAGWTFSPISAVIDSSGILGTFVWEALWTGLYASSAASYVDAASWQRKLGQFFRGTIDWSLAYAGSTTIASTITNMVLMRNEEVAINTGAGGDPLVLDHPFVRRVGLVRARPFMFHLHQQTQPEPEATRFFMHAQDAPDVEVPARDHDYVTLSDSDFGRRRCQSPTRSLR